MAQLGECGAQVDGCGRFAHAAFLVDHGKDGRGRRCQHLGVDQLNRSYIWWHCRDSSPDSTGFPAGRSEEHTSELQSHLNLVCRLLLEKKNMNLKNTSDFLTQ